MAIPDAIERKLASAVWLRPTTVGLEDAFSRVGLTEPDPVREFYSRFWGPFRSGKVGYELLDLVEQEDSVVSGTETLRSQFGFPDRFLVMSSLLGQSILVYDVITGHVFDMDFDGGDVLLLADKLSPRWKTWWDFAQEYFA